VRYLPPLIQKIGHHAHESLWLDLTTFLQLIQVQAELQPLRSKIKGKGKSQKSIKGQMTSVV